MWALLLSAKSALLLVLPSPSCCSQTALVCTVALRPTSLTLPTMSVTLVMPSACLVKRTPLTVNFALMVEPTKLSSLPPTPLASQSVLMASTPTPPTTTARHATRSALSAPSTIPSVKFVLALAFISPSC